MYSDISGRVFFQNYWFWTFTHDVLKFKSFSFSRGIPFLTQECSFRLSSIANQLAKSSYDIVALQEVCLFKLYTSRGMSL